MIPMEWKRKANAVAQIPDHLQTMTLLVIAALLVSIVAMVTAIGAIRYAN